jgi:glycosyltransferase involved in cell wall biosynthesis
MSDPTFSVIVPSYNEARAIDACLEAVRRQEPAVRCVDLIVADNGSTDGTVDIARRHGATVIENRSGSRHSISALRNVGAQQARGDVLAFLDGDMVAPPEWLSRAEARYADGFEGALGFATIAPPDAGWVGRVWGSRFPAKADQAREVGFLTGRNLLVTRRAFDAVGGFDEELITGEDKDFSLRVRGAGHRVLWDPGVKLVHLGYEHGLAEFVRKEWWRQGHTLAVARAEGFTFRSLRNPLLSAWHAAMAVGSGACLAGGAIGACGVLFGLWAGPSLLFAAAEARRQGWRDFLPLFVLIWLRWTIAGAALVWQVVRREGRVATEGKARA